MTHQLQSGMAQLSLGKAVNPAKTFIVAPEEGLCSVFPLSIRPGDTKVFRYDVEIIKLDPRGREDFNKVLTGRASDDGQRSLHRRVCADAMLSVFNRTGSFGTNRQARYVYDSKKNLFTNMPIQVQELTTLFAVEVSPLCQSFLHNNGQLQVRIVRSEAWILDLNNLKEAMVSDVTQPPDHTLRTFLELLTSQPFLNEGTHNIIGMGQLFEIKPARKLQGGIHTHQGIAKGVRIIDNDGRPKPALVVDVKTCAFYDSTVNFDEVVGSMLSEQRVVAAEADPGNKFWCRVRDMYKGVRARLTYDSTRSIVIYGFSREPMSQQRVEQASFQQFYAQKGIRLNNLHWPAIRAEGSQNNLYPIQCVAILPNQRVPLEKMTENISRELLNANTTDPNVRYNTIVEQIRKLTAADKVEFLRSFGVDIALPSSDGRKPNMVPIGVRQAPQIEFGNHAKVTPENGRFNDRNQKYFLPGRQVENWLVAFSSDRNVRAGDVRRFTDSIIRYAGPKGLQLPEPQYQNIDIHQLDGEMKRMSESRNPPRLILYFDSKRNKSHDLLKLLERRYTILTQQLCIETFQKQSTGASTYTNIANKINMKLFGLNYIPVIERFATQYDLRSGRLLVIGYDVSHPGKATGFEMYQLKERFKKLGVECPDYDSLEPSVVGICANYAKEPNIFIGDYFYQPSRREAVDQESLCAQMTSILTRLAKNRRGGQMPEIVFVVRDGVSEGQFPMAVRDELPALKEGCTKFLASYHPKFVFVIVSKRHQKRFFNQQGGGRAGETPVCMNPVPGAVIDRKMVRADVPEFWMQSHRPLKGTAKLPQYAIPVNEAEMSTDELQAFLNALCYSHQIVTSAVSIPEPVYQAHELAKRGSNNFRKFREEFPGNVPKKKDTSLVDYQELTKRLAYGNNILAETRFTA